MGEERRGREREEEGGGREREVVEGGGRGRVEQLDSPVEERRTAGCLTQVF